MKPKQIKSENPPLFFVPKNILCSCGQDMMIMEIGRVSPNPYITVMCTQPWCSQLNLDKRIDLTKFAFTEYELL